MESPLGAPGWPGGCIPRAPLSCPPTHPDLPQEEREEEAAATGAKADGPAPGLSTSEGRTLSAEKEPYRALKEDRVLQVLGHSQEKGEGGMVAQVLGLWFREHSPGAPLSEQTPRRPHIKRFVCSTSLCLSCLKSNSHSASVSFQSKRAYTPVPPPSIPRTLQTIPGNWRRTSYLGPLPWPCFPPSSLLPSLTYLNIAISEF